MVWIKVCGVTSVQDAIGCAQAGADAIGLNFYQRSPRYCRPEMARAIVQAVGTRMEVIGVFVDASYEEILALKQTVGFGAAQLHGSESPEFVERLLPSAYKALRVQGPSFVQEAGRYGGERLLLDAYVQGIAGGTGARFDWAAAKQVAAQRRVIVAGGLRDDNVAEAIALVNPYGVDVASGVESSPGRKDLGRVRAFVKIAKLGA
jgi:phosphoribosylanthranilate isomerase